MGHTPLLRYSWLRRIIALKIASSLIAGCLAIGFAPAVAWAQTENGQININVEDAASKKPLVLARVLLDGPVISSELTTSNGKVIFRDAPAGVYTARVAKSGYQSVTTASFEVIAGQAVEVAVQLVSTADIKTIGTVVVKSSAAVSSSSISQDSAIRKLSPTLNDALGKLSGVSTGTDSSANDAAETISLQGHDPSQTQLMLDGIPLNSPGSAGDLRSISSDLFGGASVSFNPVAGALGGSVNYRTLEPTRSWQEGITTSLGNLGGASSILSLQGSLGSLGVAFVHSIRGSNNLLDGQRYLDASGFDYVHSGADQTGGDLLKLRAPIGQAQSLSAMFLSSDGYNDALCTVFTGPVPCGLGPGNSNYRHMTLESLSDTALIGLTSVQVSAYGSQTRFDRNLLSRFVNSVPLPYGSETEGTRRGLTLNAQLPSRERHTISLQATTSSSANQSTALVPSSSVFANGQASSAYTSLSVADSIRSNDTLNFGDHIGLAKSNGGAASLIAGVSGQWSPNSHDALSGSVDLGNNASGPNRFGILSDPASLQFNCADGFGYGNGPGDSPSSQSSVSERVTWQHRFSSLGQLSGSLYNQVQNDTLLNALVNGSALPSGYFPAGYFQTAQQIFQSSGGCGKQTALFGPANLYLTVPVSGVKMVYQGISLNGAFKVSRDLAAEPFYDVQVVKPFSDDPRLSNAFSPVISGSQLAGVPLHQAGMTMDYRAPHSAVELLADARYVSGGNRSNLPGYVTADAGASIDFTHGTLTASASNIFNKFGYQFASSSYSVGIPTVDAGTLATIARPLSPRQYTLTYSVKIGAPQTPRRAANLAGPAGDGPGGPRGPGEGGRGPLASAPSYPQSPPADPFALDASGASCAKDASATVNQILAAMKAYVAAIEGAKTSSGYPASLSSQPLTVPGFAVAYHPLQDTYALTFSPQTLGTLRGLFGCAPVHVGTKDQATAMHLYIPQASSFFRMQLSYTPAVGLYIVRQPPTPGQEQFRVYKLPSTPPKQPLQIVESDRCTTDLRPIAQTLLSSLSQYVTAQGSGRTAQQPAGWNVVSHAVPKGYWLELQPQAPEAIPALLNCARISTGALPDIQKTGLGAAMIPSLNFAPPYGLYVVRPTRPPGP